MTVHLGDCVEWLESLEPESADAIVTDPPYGLGFMGKTWDAMPPGPRWAAACLRALKPGGHLVAFGGTRTVHRLAVALEDAGFEIRDTVSWLYWSGFPKSLDVSKALDGAAGVEREVVGLSSRHGGGTLSGAAWNVPADIPAITTPATPEAIRWQGWGTALKPAQEPAILARKPLGGTVAACVLEHGTGALNIDGCRWAPGAMEWPGPGEGLTERQNSAPRESPTVHLPPMALQPHDLGRWPGNVLAVPKASRSERERGTDGLPAMNTALEVHGAGTKALNNSARAGAGASAARRGATIRNGHPTIKPVRLMRWLVRLVTPPGGLVVDPFTGSGTTGIAAALEGFRFAGAEREPDYHRIAVARMAHATRYPEAWGDTEPGSTDGEASTERAELETAGQLGLLGGLP